MQLNAISAPCDMGLTKTLRVMKLITLFLFGFNLQLWAHGYSQTVTFSGRNVPLEKVLENIKRQTGYVIVGNYDLIRAANPVTVSAKEEPVETFLTEVLKNQSLTFSIRNTTISLRKKMIESGVVNKPLFEPPPPPIDIMGRVLNETGEPLAGVTVTVKGTSKRVATNDNGQFTLNGVNGDAVLIFSSVGYLDLEESVQGRTTMNLSLEIALNSLDETVVIGYGTRKRQHVTGAVSTVSGEVLESRPISNALAGLQGAIPGVLVQRGSGEPGNEGFSLGVRGYSSVNGGNSPLVMIDGIAGGNIDLINPEDIASITVLKDAAASIYGARAAGGVILVTTKKGRRGTPRVSYNNNFASVKLTGLMKSVTNLQLAEMDNEANINAGGTAMYTEEMFEKLRNSDPNPIDHPIYKGWKLFFFDTDWIAETFEKGFQQKHNVSLSGGSDNSTYYFSGSIIDQKGVLKYAPDDNKRYNLRMNYDYTIIKGLRFESNMSYDDQVRTEIGTGSRNMVIAGVTNMPNHPVYNAQGQYYAQGGWGNSVAFAKEGVPSDNRTRNINTNFKLVADVLPGLKLTAQAGINFRTQKNDSILRPFPLYRWDGTIVYYRGAAFGQGSIYRKNAEDLYKNFTGFAEYSKTFGGKHDISIMAGVSQEQNRISSFQAYRAGMTSDEVFSLNLATGDMQTSDATVAYTLRSAFSRIGYSFDNKYMIEGNLRYDGSSRFHPDQRWGLFPGISAAWRISGEKFMDKATFIDDLKIRASYGETGNQEGIRYYDFLQLLLLPGSGPSGYPFGPGRQDLTVRLDTLASPGRTWETLANRNIGIDVTALKSKLNFTFDYFVKVNKDMLMPVNYPALLGAIAPLSNSGELKTWGFETSIAWADKVGGLDYSARVILSDAQNKITRYEGADSYVLGYNQVREGYPIDSYFAYEFDGLIRNQAELDAYKQLEGVPNDIGIGDAKFKDLNGDGQISLYGDPTKAGDDGDVVNMGSATPRYTLGLNLGAKFKNFDILVFAQSVLKRTIFREGEYSMPFSYSWIQPPVYYYGKTWSTDRPDAQLPRLSNGEIRNWNYQPSSMQKVNAAYLRLKNIQIGYTLPEQLTRKVAISRARIYVSGQDIWETHKVEGGWDPESARDGYNYPFSRFYSFGLDVNF